MTVWYTDISHTLLTNKQASKNINKAIVSIMLFEVSNKVYPDYGAVIHPSGLALHSGLTALISFLSID